MAGRTIRVPLRGLWIACKGKRQTQATLPLHQRHMGKTWSLLQCSAWFLFFFFFEKLSEVQGIECPTVIPPSFHLFDTMTETSQLVHQQVKPELTLSTYYNSDLQSLTHLMWATFFSTTGYILLASVPNSLLHSRNDHYSITDPHLPAASFMGFQDSSKAGALQLGRSRLSRVKWDVLEQVCLSSILQL